MQTSPDSNVEKNREMLLQRSRLGLKKYGCTTEALTLRETLQHALEEALDITVVRQCTALCLWMLI